MLYEFDDFPLVDPTPRTATTDTHFQYMTPVELADGRVLVAWLNNYQPSPNKAEIKVGYADSVAAMLAADNSVTYDRTLIRANDSGSGRGALRHTLCRGPDGTILLWVWSPADTLAPTLDASIETPTTSNNSWVCLWRSTDEGDTFDFVDEIHDNAPGYLFGPSLGPCPIEVDPSNGLWVVLTPYRTASEGTALYTSADSGASWTLEHAYGNRTGSAGLGFLNANSGHWITDRDGISSGFDAEIRRSTDDYATVDTYSVFNANATTNIGKRNGAFGTYQTNAQLLRLHYNLAGTATLYTSRAGLLTPDWTDEEELAGTEPGEHWVITHEWPGFAPASGSYTRPFLSTTDLWHLACVGNQVIGLARRICPFTTPLMIPHKTWAQDPNVDRALARTAENWRILRAWSATVAAGGAAAGPFIPPYATPSSPDHHAQNQRALERWATGVCWSPGLVIPHKGDPARDDENWRIVERWASHGTL